MAAMLPALRLAQPPAEVAARLEAIALATPRTVRVAGEGLWVTYVTRSALWGFPDYTSVKVVPDGAGSVVTIFARARFGRERLRREPGAGGELAVAACALTALGCADANSRGRDDGTGDRGGPGASCGQTPACRLGRAAGADGGGLLGRRAAAGA